MPTLYKTEKYFDSQDQLLEFHTGYNKTINGRFLVKDKSSWLNVYTRAY